MVQGNIETVVDTFHRYDNIDQVRNKFEEICKYDNILITHLYIVTYTYIYFI